MLYSLEFCGYKVHTYSYVSVSNDIHPFLCYKGCTLMKSPNIGQENLFIPHHIPIQPIYLSFIIAVINHVCTYFDVIRLAFLFYSTANLTTSGILTSHCMEIQYFQFVDEKQVIKFAWCKYSIMHNSMTFVSVCLFERESGCSI